MQKSLTWFGSSSANAYIYPPYISVEENAMTAIAIVYDRTNQDFVVAADGRCTVYRSGSSTVASDTEQKIFPFESQHAVFAYALTGISSIGSFQLIPQIRSQFESLLSSRVISQGYEFAFKASSRLVTSLEVETKEGKLPQIPPWDPIGEDPGTKRFTLFVFGHFRGKPFFSQLEFHGQERSSKLRVDSFPSTLVQNLIWHTGSQVIGRMLYDPSAAIDYRIAQFKNDPNIPKDALTTTSNFVKACSLPFAPELDPQCRLVGGHLHAARISKDGFTWLIPPL